MCEFSRLSKLSYVRFANAKSCTCNRQGFITCVMGHRSVERNPTHSIIRDRTDSPEFIGNKVSSFLNLFPEYRKTLTLAVVHEESATSSRNYQGWQWHDVETHPTKLIRLVTEGFTCISLRTRHANYYLLRDRDRLKKALARVL